MRDSSFCTGCPERPVFSALKIAKREFGPIHVSSDIGCHTFSVFPPFGMGNTILGYGMGLASSAAVGGTFGKRTISVMGDGGFWHNGLLTGVASAVHNDLDSVLLVLDNGYTASTGGQFLPSTAGTTPHTRGQLSIEAAARALGAPWVKTVRSYSVAKVIKLLRKAMTMPQGGLKVIVARGECQLQKQQRTYPEIQAQIAAGDTTVRTRFGIDDEVCTGDHACIRLSGCPSLSIKDNPDPLKLDPVAHVNQGCVGCGLCGDIAHAAVLCPSFYRAEITHNPTWWTRLMGRTQSQRHWITPSRAFGGATVTELPDRPYTILLYTMGGQGGAGVEPMASKGGRILCNWIVHASRAAGYPVQSTLTPGTGQRTGLNSLYLEIYPATPPPRRPKAGLSPRAPPGRCRPRDRL